MKIALCSTFVPFVNGGYRNIVEWLELKLLESGHEVERIYLPEVDAPERLMKQMAALRWIDLSAADRLICFRPQSHLVPHPNKVVWFIHHLRVFYDLWDSHHRTFPADARHRGLRDALRGIDTAALREARAVFSNSKVVSDRLRRFNGIDSEPLLPPIFAPERFAFRSLNDEVLCVCRMEDHKRQHLLVEALAHCREPVRLRLAGVPGQPDYLDRLRQLAAASGTTERITFVPEWIAETTKEAWVADCLAVAYAPLDEDSYGYPVLEAAHAAKAALTTSDAGGTLEFVEHGVTGEVSEPEPQALAAAMDRLHADRDRTRRLGAAARERIATLGIEWPHVVDRLLA